MAVSRSHPTRPPSARETDDLKLVSGIGPAFEKRLHQAGIRTFARLAALTPGKVAAYIPGLSAKQIERQSWIPQARRLAARKKAKRAGNQAAVKGPRQHYANFTVELLLDEKNQTRRTHVVHVQTGTSGQWAGWVPQELIDFFRCYASGDSPLPGAALPDRPEPARPTDRLDASAAGPLQEAATRAREGESALQPVLAAGTAAAREHPSASWLALPAEIQLRSLEALLAESREPRRILEADREFEMRVTMALENIEAGENEPLEYDISIYGKNMDTGVQQAICEAHGIASFTPSLTLSAGRATLQRGLHRMKVLVALRFRSSPPELRPGLAAQLEAGLLQVY